MTPKLATAKTVPRAKASLEDLVVVENLNIHFNRQPGNNILELKLIKVDGLNVIVVWLFLAMPRVCMQFVVVVFPYHTHILSDH